MKKILSLILFVVLLMGVLPVFAAETVALALEYDDYYTVTGTATVLSQTVSGEGVALGDTAVVEITDGKLHAVGLGTATVSAGDETYEVTVSKADLALIMIAGQSNAAGDSSDHTMAPDAVGEYEGQFFITNTNGTSLSTSSVTFEKAKYCAEHGGRMEETSTSSAYDKWSAAAASSLARKLVDLWDMKVWVVNTAVCASTMERWKQFFLGLFRKGSQK